MTVTPNSTGVVVRRGKSGLERSTYLLLILIWAGPLIILQWLIGLDMLLKRWKVLVPGILIPTLYLTLVDAFAIGSNTWTINPTQSLGTRIPLINVPVEEAVFFLVTNTLIVQGLIFIMNFPPMWRRMRRLVSLARLGPRRKPAKDRQ